MSQLVLVKECINITSFSNDVIKDCDQIGKCCLLVFFCFSSMTQFMKMIEQD